MARIMTWLLRKFIAAVAFISGQYIPKPNGKRWMKIYVLFYAIVFTTIIGLLANIYPTLVIFLEWIKCPIRYDGVCFLNMFYSDQQEDQLPVIALKDIEDNKGANVSQLVGDLEKFDDFAKIVFLFSATSGTLSYLIFVFVLWHKYISLFWKQKKNEGGGDGGEGGDESEGDGGEEGETDPLLNNPAPNDNNKPQPLHPFDNTEDSTNTRLDGMESFWYGAFLTINIVLIIAMMLVFIFGQYGEGSRHLHTQPWNLQSKTNTYRILEISTFAIYTYSMLCTISSCFIFSKVMYGVQNNCHKLKDKFEQCNTDVVKKEIDRSFIAIATNTIGFFQFWFFVHWVMFIISSFLSLSLLFDAVSLYITATTPHSKKGVPFHPLEMVFLTIFAVSNSFFFLYPCIRAAGVTESRKTLIREVNNNDMDFDNKLAFMAYLKGQNFSFRLSILCAHVSFNLNIAYISIFIGLLGVLIRISTNV